MYIHSEDVHNLKSPSQIVPLVMEIFRPKSVLDVGCGIGTWLHEFKKGGLANTTGIDGNYVDRSLLAKHIDENEFVVHDLSKPFDLEEKFDIVICLEVAEHLPESSAEGLIKSLTSHSNVVIFSAAIPGQGGQNHINEKDYSYWIKLFKSYNFKAHDLVRPIIWNNPDIDYWYKQNMLVFISNDSTIKIPEISFIQSTHPDIYKRQIVQLKNDISHIVNGNSGLANSFKIFLKALQKKFF